MVHVNGQPVAFEPEIHQEWSGQLYERWLPGRIETVTLHEAVVAACTIGDGQVRLSAIDTEGTTFELHFSGVHVVQSDLDPGTEALGDDISLLDWGWPDRFALLTTHLELHFTARRLDYRIDPVEGR